MKKLLIVACIFAFVLLSSCDLLLDLFGSQDDPDGNFWAINIRTNKPYRLKAELLASGTYCNVWVQTGCGIDASRAAGVASHFDNEIYPKMIENFSLKNFTFDGEHFNNIIEFADALADEDGKLCILLLDILDNYNPTSFLFRDYSYVAGYFWLGNFFETNGSNLRDMIYIDTYPGMEDPEKINEAYGTLAHEMQHLMNFATTIVTRSKFNNQGELEDINLMDTWIDEGLSAAAEWVYSGQHSQQRIEWFNKNGGGDGRIDRGNNFFVWDNYESIAVLDDYSTVYIFFQWLRLQAGKTGIYSEIMSSKDYNHNAVVDAMKSYGYSNWENLLRTWLAANYINAQSGPYGYMNDSELKKIKVPAPKTITARVDLAPGEGVYSLTGSTQPVLSNQGQNIKNGYIANNTFSNTFSPGSILLTFNGNTMIISYDKDNKPVAIPAESGVTTGTVIPSASIVTPNRSMLPEISGPYRIDAGDVIGRDVFSIDQIGKKRLSGAK